MKRIGIFGLLLPALLLAGCATLPLPEDRQCERLHPRLAFCLLTPGEMGQPRERMDMVRVTTPEGGQRFVGQLSLQAERLDMAAHTPTGLGLFRLRWDGETLNHDAPMEDLPVSPRRLVALLQWVLAPVEALDQAVVGGQVREQAGPTGTERILELDGGRVVGRASLEAGPDGAPGAITIEIGDDIRIRLTPLD